MENPFSQSAQSAQENNVFIDLLQTVVVALSICITIYLFIATPNEVHGQSMEPSFHDGDLLLTNKIVQYLGNTKLGRLTGDYHRGDVVIFRHTLSQEDFIKRVIGIEGDTIAIKNGDVYVNDIKLDEPYLPKGRKTEPGSFLQQGQTLQVPENSYFVLGDNRSNSTDSRSNLVRFVKRNQMRGRVMLRYWPLGAIGFIPKYKHEELQSYNGFYIALNGIFLITISRPVSKKYRLTNVKTA